VAGNTSAFEAAWEAVMITMETLRQELEKLTKEHTELARRRKCLTEQLRQAQEKEQHCQRRIIEIGQKLSDAEWWQYQKEQKKGARK
jgi:chromosome segregation ATPase